MNSHELWSAALEQLEAQMTQATFTSHLKATYSLQESWPPLVVATKSAISKDWLENRLFPTVKRVVMQLAGGPVDIKIVLDVPEAPIPEDDLGQPGFEVPEAGGPKIEDFPPEVHHQEDDLSFADTFARNTDFYSIKMDMGFWVPELQYDNLFWAPYLGSCWPFYRHLLMHWTRSVKPRKEKGLLDMSRPENHCFTPPFRLSYRKATRWLGKKNYKVVPGGVYECHKSNDMRKVGLRLTQCQGCHDLHDWRPEAGGGRCYYWREGLLHKLFEEHLLTIEISSTNRAKIQVWRTLGLLTPWQVSQLNAMLQAQHENWLERYGHKFGISFDEWSEIDYRYMATHRDDYGTRRLYGEPPENPFLQPCGRENGTDEVQKRDHVVANLNGQTTKRDHVVAKSTGEPENCNHVVAKSDGTSEKRDHVVAKQEDQS
jgi:hypothetical protein